MRSGVLRTPLYQPTTSSAMRNNNGRSRTDSTAFPLRQMIVLGICRICEPIAFMSIFPYIYYMIDSFHITENDKQIALYAGLVTSAFAFAECLSGPIWGRLSDRYGRKPVLLTGLAGTGLSMLMFGFSKNLPLALLARALGGLLNGNIGVIQTTVAEVVTVEAHQARAYATMPFVWCLGSIVGSAMGGALADPVRNYPDLFQPGTLFDRYPYLLTNLVSAAVVILSMSVGVLFLEETHEDKQDRRDMGLQAGNWILRKIGLGRVQSRTKHDLYTEETLALIGEDDTPPDYSSTAASPRISVSAALPPPAYQSIESSPRQSESEGPRRDTFTAEVEEALNNTKRDCSVANAFTKQVILNIVGFGILAYHTISAEQLLPVLFSLPESDSRISLPFQFSGGFGLSTKSIGGILAVQGFIQMISTMVLFPMVTRRLGTLMTYRLVVLSYPLLYLAVPYLTLVPTSLRMPAIFAVIVWKVTAQAFAFPSTNMMLANSAPSKKVLGTLNGVAASAASGCRAFGPTVSGVLQSAGLSLGVLGLPWWVNALIACSGATISMYMVEQRRRSPGCEKRSATGDADSLPSSPAILALRVDAAQVAAESLNASSDNLLQPPGSPLLTRMSLDLRRNTD